MVRRLMCLCLVAASACSFPEQPLPRGNRQVVVHAILDPSQRYQFVRLTMTDGAKAAEDELTDATISVTAPDGTVMFARPDSVRGPSGNGIYELPEYRIDLEAAGASLLPGSTYKLRIVLRNGAVVTGETTIPSGSPASLPPPSPFQRRQDTLRLAWDRVPGARTYDVQVWSGPQDFVGDYPRYYYGGFRYSTFADTSVTLAGTARDWEDGQIFQANTNTRVIVYAVDENYYEYYRLLGDPFIGAAPTRLEGGLGVFASMVPVVQRVLAVK